MTHRSLSGSVAMASHTASGNLHHTYKTSDQQLGHYPENEGSRDVKAPCVRSRAPDVLMWTIRVDNYLRRHAEAIHWSVTRSISAPVAPLARASTSTSFSGLGHKNTKSTSMKRQERTFRYKFHL